MLLVVPTLGQKGGNVEFVQDLYRIFLAREAETAGLDNWVGHLASGRLTRAQTIEAIENAAKTVPDVFLQINPKAGQLYRAFQAIVARNPTQFEFNVYYPMAWELVLINMYNSQEYQGRPPRATDDDAATFASDDQELLPDEEPLFEDDGAMAGAEVSNTLSTTASNSRTTPTLEVVAYVLGAVIIALIVIVVVLAIMVVRKHQNL